jgi:Domain of unknown function (DUF4184)
MPLTYAHPAAAIPLRRLFSKNIPVLSALVIGSVMPDVPYFLPLLPERAYSHSLAGLFGFCLPGGILVYVVFLVVLKPPLLALLPVAISSRLDSVACNLPRITLGYLIQIAFALLAGAITHLLWDAFTHEDAPFVRAWPLLSLHLTNIGGYQVTIYKVLQHGSTFSGLALLAYWLQRWYRRTAICVEGFHHHLPAGFKRLLWFSLFLISAVNGLWSGISALMMETDGVPLRLFLGRAVINGTSALLVSLLFYCFCWHIQRIAHRVISRQMR